MKHQPIRFTLEDILAANQQWRFNCGPGALCAVLGLTPAELRPHCLDFEQRGYTNPTLLIGILKGLDVDYRRVWRADNADRIPTWPDFGLARIQWGGRWTKTGARMSWRYPHTHWVGVRVLRKQDGVLPEHDGLVQVFDINAVGNDPLLDGWLSVNAWARVIVPYLTKDMPGANGEWWPTHCFEILNAPKIPATAVP